MWRGGLSYRRLWVLIKALPPESATQTALRDVELADLDELRVPEPDPEVRHGPWSHADYLTAQLIDAVRELVYVASIAGQLTPVPKPPQPLPRPGVRRAVAVSSALAEAQVLYLNQFRARG